MAGTTKSKGWSYSAGERGRNRVRVFEHPTGVLMVEFRDRGKRRRVSLGHRDREKAKRDADEAAARLASAEKLTPEGPRDITLGELFELYLDEVTPQKSPGVQKFDRAAVERLRTSLGERRPVKALSKREWDLFIRERQSGRTTGRSVGPRTVARDLKLLLAVLNWATLSGDGLGGVLLERNPLKGLPLPSEKNPRRPSLTSGEYQALLEAAGSISPMLPSLLVLAHETGHRIGAIRRLRWSDVDLENASIRWRAETDKIGVAHVTPLTEEAVATLREQRGRTPGIGDSFVFPAPTDPSQPLSRHLVRDWWKRVEAGAGIARIEGRGWHSMRRKFASELREVPLRDLCDLGGWKDPDTVVRVYQRSSEEQLRRALERRRPA